MELAEIYTLDYLLDRIENKMTDISKNNKLKMTRPIVDCKNRHTFIGNFQKVCSSINRDPSMLMNYVISETKMESSLAKNNALIISGTLRSNQVEQLIKMFTIKYVQCSSCKSQDTVYIKEHKITTIKCNNCNSTKSIDLKFN